MHLIYCINHQMSTTFREIVYRLLQLRPALPEAL
jgi:hypothetical protein